MRDKIFSCFNPYFHCFHYIALLVLIVAPCIVYFNSFDAPFVYDDLSNISDNPKVRLYNLDFENIKKATFSGLSSNRWLPNLSIAINYYYGATDTWGYHLVNLAVHVLVGIVVYFLLFLTLTMPVVSFDSRRAREISLFAAVIWSLHPLQTNAVTYIVQRMTSMAALFFLLSLLFYVLARLQRGYFLKRFVLFFTSFLFGILALVSKENAYMLPLIIVAYELYFFTDLRQSINLKKTLLIGCLAVFTIFSLSWIFLGKNPLLLFDSIFRGYAVRDFNLTERLLTESRIFFYYIGLIILPLPSRLNFLHDYTLSHSLTAPPQTLIAVLGIGLFLYIIYYFFRRDRLLSFALFWFFANLLIESTIIPLMLLFEHRLYLPSVMLILLAILFIYKIKNKFIYRSVCLVVIVIFGFFTWQRNVVWSNGISLWSDVVSKSPRQIDARLNLGREYMLENRYQEAFEVYSRAVADGHRSANIYANMGGSALKIAKTDLAVKILEHAITLDFNNGTSHYNLGLAYAAQGNLQKARRHMMLGMELEKVGK
jgi:hypothetical protein